MPISLTIQHLCISRCEYHSNKEQFQDALSLFERLRNKHKSSATGYHNLAETHFTMKSYTEALEYFKQASALRLETLGMSTANSFHRLGVVYCIMGDFTSALEAFKKRQT